MLSKKIIVISVSVAMSLSMAMVSMAAVGYVSDGQGWKYYGIDGSVTDIQNTGWLQDQNKWRFISEGDPSNTGISVIDGKLYCFTNDGYLQTGWVQGKYGSLNPVTGESKDNLMSGQWYYFGSDGGGVTGWQQIDGKWYYFGPDSIMYRYETTPDGYYVDGNGECTEEGQKLLAELNDIDAGREAEEAKTLEEKVQEVVDFTNAEREKGGLAPLEVDDSLMEAAAIRAEEISENYSHTRPNGLICSSILSEYGVHSKANGENILRGISNAAGAVESWMRSEGHKKNLLKSNYTKIGVGYNEDFGGWVQIFIED